MQKIDKAIAIANIIINLTNQLVRHASIAYPKKKPSFLKKRKRHYRQLRKEKQFANAFIAIAPAIAAMQTRMILSQPIEKFKDGTNTSY